MLRTEQLCSYSRHTDYYQLWLEKKKENHRLRSHLVDSKKVITTLHLKLTDILNSIKEFEENPEFVNLNQEPEPSEVVPLFVAIDEQNNKPEHVIRDRLSDSQKSRRKSVEREPELTNSTQSICTITELPPDPKVPKVLISVNSNLSLKPVEFQGRIKRKNRRKQSFFSRKDLLTTTVQSRRHSETAKFNNVTVNETSQCPINETPEYEEHYDVVEASSAQTTEQSNNLNLNVYDCFKTEPVEEMSDEVEVILETNSEPLSNAVISSERTQGENVKTNVDEIPAEWSLTTQKKARGDCHQNELLFEEEQQTMEGVLESAFIISDGFDVQSSPAPDQRIAEAPSLETQENVMTPYKMERLEIEPDIFGSHSNARVAEHFGMRIPEEPVAKSKTKVSCKCRYECRNLTTEQREHIFKELDKLPYHEQGTYLMSHIRVTNVMRRRNGRYSNPADSRRQFTMNYTVPDREGKPAQVCSRTFKDVFGVTCRRLQVLQSKIKDGYTSYKDKRGTNPVSCNKKYLEEHLALMNNHLMSVPQGESNYYQNKNMRNDSSSALNVAGCTRF